MFIRAPHGWRSNVYGCVMHDYDARMHESECIRYALGEQNFEYVL